jgi:hypothetical protein
MLTAGDGSRCAFETQKHAAAHCRHAKSIGNVAAAMAALGNYFGPNSARSNGASGTGALPQKGLNWEVLQKKALA